MKDNEIYIKDAGEEGTTKPKESTPLRRRSSFYANKDNVDPFPNRFLIDLQDKKEDTAVRAAVEEMSTDALAQGLTNAWFEDLRKIVMAKLGVFCTDFSQSSANMLPLKSELKQDAKLVHVKIRKYRNSQRRFLQKMAKKLPDACLVYSNPTSN